MPGQHCRSIGRGGGGGGGGYCPQPVEPPSVKRFVAKIDWESFGSTGSDGRLKQAEVDVCRLAVTALPLQHGADYVCLLGFGPAHAGPSTYLQFYRRPGAADKVERGGASSCCG